MNRVYEVCLFPEISGCKKMHWTYENKFKMVALSVLLQLKNESEREKPWNEFIQLEQNTFKKPTMTDLQKELAAVETELKWNHPHKKRGEANDVQWDDCELKFMKRDCDTWTNGGAPATGGSTPHE